MNAITEEFSKRIIGTFKQDGVEWLDRLPQLLDFASQNWSIRLLPPFQPLSYSFVAPTIRTGGVSVVLKASVPNRESLTEIEVLHRFRGHGAVQLIDAEPNLGLMLLERLEPGASLREMRDDRSATSIAAEVMARLWMPAPDKHNFPTVSDWSLGLTRLRNRFAGGTGPFPKDVVSYADGLLVELLSSMSDVVLLHGDLHHRNILSAAREPWLAVDPKGVVGEPEYEVGAWLRNPFPQILKIQRPRKLVARRIDQLAEIFGFDRSRLVAWGFAQAVLAAWWSYDEGLDDWEKWLVCAGLFDVAR